MKKKHFKMASQETLCPQDLVDQGRQENQLPAIGEESKRNGRQEIRVMGGSKMSSLSTQPPHVASTRTDITI